jgi:hypothetical protein
MAAMQGEEGVANLLLNMRNDVELDAEDIYGYTALGWACTKGHGSIVELLLDQPDIGINYRGAGGLIPLERAVLNDHEHIVRLLLQCPDLNMRAGDGTLRHSLLGRLMSAPNQPKLNILQLLVEQDNTLLKADSSEQDPPLCIATIKRRSIPMVRFLMSQDDINVNLRTKKKWDALYFTK